MTLRLSSALKTAKFWSRLGCRQLLRYAAGAHGKQPLTGVELDSTSGRIARKLYPNADIKITGYENTKFADNVLDVAIGNVPFGDYSLHDKRYDKEHLLIHDYFFVKSLDKVRPGR